MASLKHSVRLARTSKPKTPKAVPTTSPDEKKLAKLTAALDIANDRVTELLAKNTVVPGYESLADILASALAQASTGKGAERHANDLPFGSQKMIAISDLYHGPQGMLWQATKKATEANEMLARDAKNIDFYEKELLGAINYLAGAILFARLKAKG